jgi:WD40 repeat protein
LIWRLADGSKFQTIKFFSEGIYYPYNQEEFSPDGTMVGVADEIGERQITCLWDVASGEVLERINDEPSGIPQKFAFSSDSKKFAVSRLNNSIQVFDFSANRQAPQQSYIGGPGGAHDGPISAVAFSPDATIVISAGRDDGLLKFWRLSDNHLLWTFKPDHLPLTGLAATDGALLHFTGPWFEGVADTFFIDPPQYRDHAAYLRWYGGGGSYTIEGTSSFDLPWQTLNSNLQTNEFLHQNAGQQFFYRVRSE